MRWLIRTVAVLVQWAIYIPIWLLGCKPTSLAVVGLWFAGLFIAMNGGPQATTFAFAVAMSGVVLLLVMIFCYAITRNVWRPPGLTFPTRAARQTAGRRERQPTWARAAQAVDAPSVATTRARLAPRLQLLMRPPPSALSHWSAQQGPPAR